MWALLFVTAVGLGPFPGVLALAVHSIGMLGRLFAETIEDIEMGPVQALTLTGASRAQIVSHAIVPSLLPSLTGISFFDWTRTSALHWSSDSSARAALVF